MKKFIRYANKNREGKDQNGYLLGQRRENPSAAQQRRLKPQNKMDHGCTINLKSKPEILLEFHQCTPILNSWRNWDLESNVQRWQGQRFTNSQNWAHFLCKSYIQSNILFLGITQNQDGYSPISWVARV